MSYQNETLGLESNENIVSTKVNWWKRPLLVVVGIGAAFGVIAYTTKLDVTNNFKAASLVSSVSKYASLSDDEIVTLFEKFKADFSKSYSTDAEEAEKYTNFKAFLELIDARNSAEALAGGSGTHGITLFADLSDDEFKSNYLGFVTKSTSSSTLPYTTVTSVDYDGPFNQTVSWVGVYTTEVNNQGYCGSCWAFSAVEQIESDSIRAGYLTCEEPLSVQQVVSCDDYADGCDGGTPQEAYLYVFEKGGVESAANYPYTSYFDTTGQCMSYSKDFLVSVTAYTVLGNEDAMEDYVMSTGPISVCLDASTWASYTSGVLSVCGDDVDHCVQAVGLNMDEGYWIVRNSWGTSWGIDGYIYLKSGQNTCDITYDATYVTVENLQ